MTRQNLFHRTATIFGAAVAAAAAVETRQPPTARTLAALGIDPKTYAAIGR